MGESGSRRPNLQDRLEYMSDMIFQLERMALENGLITLASLLKQAHDEAGRRSEAKRD